MAMVTARAKVNTEVFKAGNCVLVDDALPDIQALLAAGWLVREDCVAIQTEFPTASSSFRAPVASRAALPLLNNRQGDVRLALLEWQLFGWNQTTQTWVALAGAGGGGGGGGGSGAATGARNLFVQAARPDVAAMLIDSLWIPTNPDGTAKDPSFWEVYTGNDTGDGGNVFVQQTAPSPLVDALWVPTNVDGTPKYLDQWQVFAGRGSVVGVGDPNLLIAHTLPSAPPAGSLFIPLAPDETAKTPDQWRVYA